MILALMTLQQWIDANDLLDNDTQTLRPDAFQTALTQLQTTQIRVLLLASDAVLLQQFNSLPSPDELEPTILVVPVMEDTPEAYVTAIRDAHRQGINPRSVVSFIHSVQQIDEFTNLSYHNPGQDFLHYHDWVKAYMPINPTQHTIVMCLGEVVQQNRKKAVEVLIPIAQQQNPALTIPDLIAKMQTLLAKEETGPAGHIYQFKMGRIEDGIFDARMIACVAEQMGIQLTVEQFNQIWQATNPDFSKIEPRLSQVKWQALHAAGYDCEFVCYTNPKDMAHLVEELQLRDQSYVLAQGELIGLAGLPLSCSFLEQKSLEEMIQDIISRTSYAGSLGLAQSPRKSKDNLVYIVTSATVMPENLVTLLGIRRVQVLLGWDGSPVHEWVAKQLTQEEDFAPSPRRQRSDTMA